MELGTGKKPSIDYFLPLLNPDQTSEERTFEEDIEMRADDVYEGFEDEERGQLREDLNLKKRFLSGIARIT